MAIPNKGAAGIVIIFLMIITLSIFQKQAAKENQNDDSALTPEQWIERFTCDTSNASAQANKSLGRPFKNFWSNLMDERCNKDPQAWRYKYIEELMSGFKHQVKDTSIDGRLANALNTIDLGNIFDTSATYFMSGSRAEDARNELRVAGPRVNDSACSQDLKFMARVFDDFQTKLQQLRAEGPNSDNSTMDERFIRLARVLDSYGRYESGMLDVKMHLLGDYNECQASELLDDDDRADARIVLMRYCWANMKSDRDLNPQLKSRSRFAHETAPGLLNTAVCLPRSCHSRHFHAPSHKQIVQKLIDSQLRLPSSIYVHETFELDSIFCLVDGDSEYGKIPLSGKLCLLFICSWILLCLSATILNKQCMRENHKKADNSHLDLSQSWRDFTSDKREISLDAPVNLDVLNPVKCIATLMVVIIHALFLMTSLATGILQVLAITDSTATGVGYSMATNVVDTFFVMSGMLGVYISLMKLDQHDKRRAKIETVRPGSPIEFIGQWIVLAANRYLRLLPLFALMFWFRRDVLTFLGWGPLWDYGLNKETMNGGCLREPWYLPLGFLAPFKWPTKQCILPAWSLSLDVIFGLLTPPVILLIRRHPRSTVSGLVALIVCSVLAYLEAFTTLEPAGLRWELFDAKIPGITALFTSLNYLYAWPIYRVPSYLVGILSGYYLYRYARQFGCLGDKVDLTTCWPAWFAGPATVVSLTYIVVHLVLQFCLYKIDLAIAPYHVFMNLYIVAVDRFVWSLANAVIFLRMTTDWRLTPMMQLFSSQLWRTLAKLSYPIVFVHWIFVLAIIGSQTVYPSFSLWNIISLLSTILMTTIPVSVFVHVVFESPLDKIIKKEILRS